MNRWFYIGGVLLALSIQANAADKIAILSLHEVITKLPEHKETVQRLESELSGHAAQLQLLESNISEKAKKLRRDSAIMQMGERTQLEKEIAQLREQFLQQAQKVEKESHQRQQEEQNKLLQRVQQAAKKVAMQQGYDLVLESSVAIYAKPTKDITAEVIQAIKQ